MAENTIPLSIEEQPDTVSDDVAVQQQMNALAIPETDPNPVMQSVVQDYNKVDMDIERIRGFGLETPEIARYLVENLYKYQDEKGEYQSLPTGYYDRLRQSGIPDTDILSTFANVRDVSPFQQFMEQAAVANTPAAGMVAGATLGSPAGLPGVIGGGLTGLFFGDAYRRMMAPELDLPYADKSGLAVAGEITGGSTPGLSLPWLAADSTISLGSNFIGKNLRNMPYAQPITEGLARGERYVTEGLEAARNNPLGYLVTEGRDIATAGAVGFGMEETMRGDRGIANDAADLIAETSAVLLDPVGRSGRFIANKTPVLKNMLENLSPDRRALAAGQRLRNILEAAGENPDEIIPRLLAGQGEFEGNDYTNLLDEAGIDFENRTAALQTGVPVLYLLESQGLESSRRRAGQALESAPDPEIREQQQRAFRNFNQFLSDLVEMDTPESLGLFANLRDQNYRASMNARVTDAFDRYQTAVNRALEGGETLDTQRVLFTTMFGEDGNGGVFGDITRQGNVLKNLIPRDIDVPVGALQIPDTEGDVSGEGLVDVYNRIGEMLSIRGQRPRLSYGRDLVSLDRVLKEFDRFANPEKYVTDDLPTLPEGEQLELPGMTVATPDADDFEDSVNTGELLNFLDAIDQSKRQALRSGNQPLLELLSDIENGAKNTLAQVSAHRNVTTRGGQFSRYFDNYLAYRDEANNVFSNAFLGEMRTKVPPELAGSVIFKGMGNPTMLRLQQMDDAANFLLNYNQRNFGTLAASNEAAEAMGVIDAAQGVELDESFNAVNVRDAQERVLRGLLNEPKFFRRVPQRDPSGNPLMMQDPNDPTKQIPRETIEQTEAFNTFLQDPTTQKILENYFPALRSDLEDVAKTRTLFETLQNEESILNQSIENGDAFTAYFAGVYDNPIKVVEDILGSPGSRVTSRENPVRDLTRLARTAAESGDPKVIQGLLDTVINHGYVFAGGSAPVDPRTGVQPFNLEKFKQYMFDPIVPGRRTSVADVLADTGVLEEGNAQLAKITQVLTEMDKIQKTLSPARSEELGTILPETVQNQVTQRIIEAGVGAAGAGIAANFYGLLARAGIVGGAGSLITSALGANLAREIVTRNPSILASQLMTEMIKQPKVMADILELARDYKPGQKLPTDKLRRMYTFLQGGALVPAGMSFQEFGGNYYGRTMPEERQAQREEAGAAPIVPQRPNPRRVQPSIVPPAQPVTPPPQAAAPRPTPPPVAQAPRPTAPAPAPTAQAPASPNQRARYAALYPFDTASDIIRTQGIGSLRG
jgi:hypothetical protein